MKKHELPELPESPKETPDKPPKVSGDDVVKKPVVEEQVEKKLPKKKPEKKISIGKRKKHKKLQRKSLQQYLTKAGYDVDAGLVKKWLYICIFSVMTIISVVIVWRLGCWTSDVCLGRSIPYALFFLFCIWTIILGFFILIGLGTIYFFLDYRIYKRTRELEEVLPDFLQLTSANIAAGMPIDRALWYSIRPTFGVLAKEMEEVAKATMSGEDLERSLVMFTDRYESQLLKRSISILIEGLHSGGELADLLNKIALNIDEIKIMKKEMAANVMTYAIFIIVAAVGIAPVLFALATELLSIIVSITGSLDLSTTSSFFSIGAVDPIVVKNFTYFSYAMLIVSSVFGASIVSVIRRGNVMEGIKAIPLYAFIAVIIYKVSFSFLVAAFGSLI